MHNKIFNICLIVSLIIISFVLGFYIAKENIVKKNELNIYSNNVEVNDEEKLKVSFDVKDTFLNDNTIIVDDDATENIIISSNKNYTLKLYSIDENSYDFKKDELIKEIFVSSDTVNIKNLMGEVMPRLYIEIISGNESVAYVPLYNGRDGGYIFKKIEKNVENNK